MSTLASFIACPNAQASLFELWGKDNLAPNPSPGIRWALSDVNKQNINMIINHKEGGYKTVEMVYGQRFLETSVSDSGGVSCDASSIDGETSYEYEIDPTVGAEANLLIRQDLLATRCERDPLYFARELKKLQDVITEKIDTDFLTAIKNNVGYNAYAFDTTTPPTPSNATIVTSTLNSDDVIIQNALQDVRFNFSNNGFSEVPFGFGTKPWNDYAVAIKAACCSQLGMNINEYAAQNNFGFGYSHKMASILGNNTDAIFLVPGAVQMIHYNQFEGGTGNINFINDDALKQGVIAHYDSSVPLTFAYRAELVCESDVFKWKISLALAYDFVFMPDDMYQDGDRYEGVNGILRFRITN